MNHHSHALAVVRRTRGVASTTIFAAAMASLPAPAFADLYTWIDERGTTVISNVMPANPRKARNFEVVVKEDPKQAASKSAVEAHDRGVTEKLLLDRIESLERELRSQQVRERPTAAAAPVYEPQYVPAQDYTADAFYPGYPGYPSYVFPYPPGHGWGYPPTTVVIGSSFGAPYRGFRNSRSSPTGRIVSYPVSVPVSVPVTRPAVVSVKR